MSDRGSLGIDDLPEGTLETIVEAVTSEMPTDAVVLFGSYARSTADEQSDIDVLALTGLVKPDLIRARTKAGLRMWGIGLDRDFVVLNTDRFYDALAAGEPFARDVARDGVAIYGELKQGGELHRGRVERCQDVRDPPRKL